MKRVVVGFFILLFVGCVTSNMVRDKNRENLNKISIGDTKKEVLEIMGTKSITTYGVNFWIYSRTEKITNPWKTEILTKDNKTYEVLFYYTDVKDRDGSINDDELTPIIFYNGKVIGYGWMYLNSNFKGIQDTQKYQLDIK